MGVHGLTTYMEENSRSYLKQYKLHDSYLVVDGNSIACKLYYGETQCDSAFGGDYDEYYEVVKDFFSLLKRCNVTPIVLFDGGYPKKKVKTILSRAESKLPILRGFSKKFSGAKFFPLFFTQTFYDVMHDLDIFCIRSDLEADIEIATVARALNCPVLSYDSDYYIYDVLYIPFNLVLLKPVQFPDSKNQYINCSIYDVNNFLREFEGLDKSMLPILATLLGNDYIDNSVFLNFFGHVYMEKNRNKSNSQRRIHGVLHWLRKETVESAKSLILSHLDSRNKEAVLKAIQSSIDDYTSNSVSESVVDELRLRLGSISLDKKSYGINLPQEIFKLYSQCKTHKHIVDIINLGVYITPLQVEDVCHESSHAPSMQLIRDIYTILTPYLQEKQTHFKVYLTVRNRYCPVIVNTEPTSYVKECSLDRIVKESREVRLKWLFRIVGVDNDDDLKLISNNNWSIFIMSFIYWIRELNSMVTHSHIHSLILMAIGNAVVQKYVGYFRNISKFMKRNGRWYEKSNGPVEVKECKSFDEMLESVTLHEKLLIQINLIPLRRTTKKSMSKAYCMSTIHLFACFQSCMFHIMQLNALLNYPLPHLRISDFYSGTLLFNLFLLIKEKGQVEKFGCNLFKETPNLAKIYTYLYEGLCKYSEQLPCNARRGKKKKKKSTKTKKQEKAGSGDDSVGLTKFVDDDDGYIDKNNMYAILQNYDI